MDAIHKDRMRITDDRQLAEWLGKQGVDVAKFQAAMKSFAVESKLKRADQLVRDAKIDGVPALMVNGRYLVPAGGNLQRLLDTADALIEQSRKDTAAKK
jgi:thiol:disulfide interchange protein DsbA